MNLRFIGTYIVGAAIAVSPAVAFAGSQVAGQAAASSATYVAAEMTKGRLNPAKSKAGDQVTVRLKEDVKSNGQVMLKKGTTITGVVKNVKRLEGKSEAAGQAQSMMEIEWLAPPAEGGARKQLSIALRSLSQVSPMLELGQSDPFADDLGRISPGPRSGPAGGPAQGAAHAGAGGGLLGVAIEAATGVRATAVGGVASAGSTTIGAIGSASTRTSGQPNPALLNMPSVVAADQQTASAIDNSFGASGSGQLFKTGRGELVHSGGARQSVQFFSHLNNDTVITSQSRDFEISGGAQMQLLVGVNKK